MCVGVCARCLSVFIVWPLPYVAVIAEAAVVLTAIAAIIHFGRSSCYFVTLLVLSLPFDAGNGGAGGGGGGGFLHRF
jgi:hypothetical protein